MNAAFCAPEIGRELTSDANYWLRRSTKDPGQQPFSYQAGVGQVIKGWDQGLLGMKLGARRDCPERRA